MVVWVTRPAETTPIIGQRGKAWSKKGHLLSPGLTTFSPTAHKDEARVSLSSSTGWVNS